MEDVKTIGILGYENCGEQDTITPLEILLGAAMVLDMEHKRKLAVKLVALDGGNVKMQMGTQVVPGGRLSGDDLFDMLYVPGGVGIGALTTNSTVLDSVRRHHESGRIVAANCSGVGLLHRAGILGDTPVTCVAAVARRLREEGANVPQPRHMWIGDPDARIWTATGSSGVHGSAVALVAHYFGRDVATTVSMMFDTLSHLGERIFERKGPEYFFHPELESKFQDFWEDKLLPKTN